jgi:hypothetical protein
LNGPARASSVKGGASFQACMQPWCDGLQLLSYLNG